MTLAYAFEDVRGTSDLGLIDAVQRVGVRMAFARDEEIYAQEDDAAFIHLVVRGAVRTIRLMNDGRRQVAGFYYPGELFGLEPGPQHCFSAEALSDADILVLRRQALRALGDDEALERAIWRATRRELDRANGHLMLLGRKSAREKVASFLAAMAARGPLAGIALPMNRQDMADYLGLTIETVSRTLTQLQSSKIVEFASARQFRVRDQSALARLAD